MDKTFNKKMTVVGLFTATVIFILSIFKQSVNYRSTFDYAKT